MGNGRPATLPSSHPPPCLQICVGLHLLEVGSTGRHHRAPRGAVCGALGLCVLPRRHAAGVGRHLPAAPPPLRGGAEGARFRRCHVSIIVWSKDLLCLGGGIWIREGSWFRRLTQGMGWWEHEWPEARSDGEAAGFAVAAAAGGAAGAHAVCSLAVLLAMEQRPRPTADTNTVSATPSSASPPR